MGLAAFWINPWCVMHTHTHIQTHSHTKTLIQSLLQGFVDFSPQNEPTDPPLSSQCKTPVSLTTRIKDTHVQRSAAVDIRVPHPVDKVDKQKLWQIYTAFKTNKSINMSVLGIECVAIQSFLWQPWSCRTAYYWLHFPPLKPQSTRLRNQLYFPVENHCL